MRGAVVTAAAGAGGGSDKVVPVLEGAVGGQSVERDGGSQGVIYGDCSGEPKKNMDPFSPYFFVFFAEYMQSCGARVCCMYMFKIRRCVP